MKPISLILAAMLSTAACAPQERRAVGGDVRNTHNTEAAAEIPGLAMPPLVGWARLTVDTHDNVTLDVQGESQHPPGSFDAQRVDTAPLFYHFRGGARLARTGEPLTRDADGSLTLRFHSIETSETPGCAGFFLEEYGVRTPYSPEEQAELWLNRDIDVELRIDAAGRYTLTLTGHWIRWTDDQPVTGGTDVGSGSVSVQGQFTTACAPLCLVEQCGSGPNDPRYQTNPRCETLFRGWDGR